MRIGLWLLLVTSVVLLGCSERPRAPALIDTPVYQNDKEGFRFVVPDGWHLSIRSDLPDEKLDKEKPLVQYLRGSPKPATFEVTRLDLEENVSLKEFLASPSYGKDKWQTVGEPEEIDMQGRKGIRYNFVSKKKGKTTDNKEVIAVRKGGRVYFFTCLYLTGDQTARDQLRRVVQNIIWNAPS